MARTGLEGSDPAAGAHLAKVAKITLRFSGALQPALSGARLIDRSGTAIPVATAVSMTAITLLPFQLRPGAYHVDWHSVGQDKTRAKGSIAFTVIP
jgi:methionine-rich copper-binding protein CopC